MDADDGKMTIYGMERVAFFSRLCPGAIDTAMKHGFRCRIADAVKAGAFNLLRSDYNIHSR